MAADAHPRPRPAAAYTIFMNSVHTWAYVCLYIQYRGQRTLTPVRVTPSHRAHHGARERAEVAALRAGRSRPRPQLAAAATPKSSWKVVPGDVVKGV